MKSKVSILIGNESDRGIILQTEEILKEYLVPYETILIKSETASEQLQNIDKDTAVIIAGTRGNFDFIITIAEQVNIPVVGIPMRAKEGDKDLEAVFSALQKPLATPIATVALDSGHNAGILAVQILATTNPSLMQKIIDFKENLKNKILKADAELSKIKFDYRTN